ncbi:MAG TPA: NADH-quinone oxidoreductase subunit L [Candidatus Saccharimonadales bacterium]|nr:NADH-quinone oxidoreductase subunit L [Candidatus Saccharimonadales bacterium]
MNEIFGWLTWGFPFIGAVMTPIFAKVNSKLRDYAAVVFAFLGAASAGLLIPNLLAGTAQDVQVPWISSLNINAGVLLDPLSIIMANVVAWISLLIMIYSLGYMHGEEGLSRYWFFMNFFIGSMLLLVMSDNLLQLFFGWEGVGMCSYALIGHWYKDPVDKWVGTVGDKALGVPMAYPPSHAGMKALVVTRIGDIGLLISIFMIYSFSGTLNFVQLSQNVSWALPLTQLGLLIPVALLFLWGLLGKSAQFPLHEWLPDAMAGPTSVSALIHAATMVTAGVYLAGRAGPMFYNAFVQYGQSSYIFDSIAWIGAFTTFMAATQALVSKELKKLLAYSTVSQIGYMMLGIGAGGLVSDFVTGLSAGLFHLMTHAIFKAAAFLAAGAILHTVDSRFMGDMGGLRKPMKITFIAMVISLLALSGVPPLSGFWSKDAVIATAVLTGQPGLMILAWATVALTFMYSLKLIGMVFLGPKSEHVKKREEEGHHLHEAPPVMLIPYVILAIATIIFGLAGPLIEAFIKDSLVVNAAPLMGSIPITASAESHAVLIGSVGSLAMLAVGGTIGYLVYISGRIKPSSIVGETGAARSVYNFLWNRWYINPVYYRIFVNGTIAAATDLWRSVELSFFDRISGAVASASIGISRDGQGVDLNAIDAMINWIGSFGRRSSSALKKIQTGVAQDYVTVFAIGLFALIVAILFFLL